MATAIPIIVLEDTRECAQQVLEAAQTLGFLYIRCDDIPEDKIDAMFSLSKEFFSLPLNEKTPYNITSSNRGFSGVHSETLDPNTQARGDFKQAFNIGEPSSFGIFPQRLPPKLDINAASLLEFRNLCHVLCVRLLRLFSIALSLPPDFFDKPHDSPAQGPSGSILRLLYYPPPSSDYGEKEGDMRAGAHSDYGSLTLLFQRPGEHGLEILSKEGGWKPVDVVPGAICVNIGDLLSYWTAGLLKSTVHRVTGNRTSTERYSIVYFCHPVDETRLEAIPSPVVRVREGRGANEGVAMTAKEHLEGRLAATYGWSKM